MVTALVRLRQALTDVVLPLDLPGAAEQRTSQTELVAQLEDYVIPRMTTIEAPLPSDVASLLRTAGLRLEAS